MGEKTKWWLGLSFQQGYTNFHGKMHATERSWTEAIFKVIWPTRDKEMRGILLQAGAGDVSEEVISRIHHPCWKSTQYRNFTVFWRSLKMHPPKKLSPFPLILLSFKSCPGGPRNRNDRVDPNSRLQAQDQDWTEGAEEAMDWLWDWCFDLDSTGLFNISKWVVHCQSKIVLRAECD